MEQAHCGAMRSTAGAGGDKEDGAEAELRKARFFAPAKNDPRKKLTENEIVAELFKMYERLAEGENK